MNIYTDITNRILAQLEAGVIPWRKTWTLGLPRSYTTGKDYRGINILVLGSRPYSSRYWTTYREAQRVGGFVRKGERATPVVVLALADRRGIGPAARQDRRERSRPVRAVHQRGLQPRPGRRRGPARRRAEPRPRGVGDCRAGLAVMPDKPQIVHSRTAQPGYSIAEDRVTLPHLGQFESAEEYFCTAYHELTHAVGQRETLEPFRARGRGRPRALRLRGTRSRVWRGVPVRLRRHQQPAEQRAFGRLYPGLVGGVPARPADPAAGGFRRPARRGLHPRQGGAPGGSARGLKIASPLAGAPGALRARIHLHVQRQVRFHCAPKSGPFCKRRSQLMPQGEWPISAFR
jgi:hypothetical protein